MYASFLKHGAAALREYPNVCLVIVMDALRLYCSQGVSWQGGEGH